MNLLQRTIRLAFGEPPLRPYLLPLLRYASRKVVARKRRMYHGTHSGMARKILKEGLIPHPKKKQWEDISAEYGKYWGVYLTPEIGEAWHFANNAAKKSGGHPTLVVVQIETQTGSLSIDEEELVQPLYNMYLRPSPKSVAEIQTRFREEVLELVETSQPLSKAGRALFKRAVPYLDLAAEAYYDWKNGHQDIDRFKHAIKRAAKALRFLVTHELERNDVVMHEPINYRGANKILGVATMQPYPGNLWEEDIDLPYYDYEKYEDMDEDDPEYIDEDEFMESEEYEEALHASIAQHLGMPPGADFTSVSPGDMVLRVLFDRGIHITEFEDIAEELKEYREGMGDENVGEATHVFNRRGELESTI